MLHTYRGQDAFVPGCRYEVRRPSVTSYRAQTFASDIFKKMGLHNVAAAVVRSAWTRSWVQPEPGNETRYVQHTVFVLVSSGVRVGDSTNSLSLSLST